MLAVRVFVNRRLVTHGNALQNQAKCFVRNIRNFSSIVGDEEIYSWPKRDTNTIINICPQGYQMVLERLGKLHYIQESGWFFAIPLVDQIRYIIDMRERALQIHPLSAITRDNVSVTVSGNIYLQFVDPMKGAYGSANPLYAITQIAQSSMRAGIGELELDEILHARQKLNLIITSTVAQAAEAWGIEIKRYELTEITPDRVILMAMDKQAAAERSRRERVTHAEGEKRAMELTSEGTKISMRNESEGELIKVKNIAEATRVRLIMEAEGTASAILQKAQAEAKAIQVIAAALQMPQGQVAAQLDVAREYVKMYGEMGRSSNTMIFSDKPADVRALLAQAASVLKVSFGAAPVVGSGSGSSEAGGWRRANGGVEDLSRTILPAADAASETVDADSEEDGDKVDDALVEPDEDSKR